MAKRLWVGQAPAVAQKKRVTITGTVRSGDDLEFKINGKSLLVECPFDDDTANAILGLAASLWAESEIPEFAEITPTFEAVGSGNSRAAILLEGPPGVPFELTSTQLHPSVDVDKLSLGSAGKNAKFSIALIGTGTGGTFTIQWDLGSGNEFSLPIDYTTRSAASIQSALIAGMASLSTGDVSVTGSGTTASPWLVELMGSKANTSVSAPVVITAEIQGGGAYHYAVVREASVTPKQYSGTITFDNWNTLSHTYAVQVFDPGSGEVANFQMLPHADVNAVTLAAMYSGGLEVVGPSVITTGGGTATFYFKFPVGVELTFSFSAYGTALGTVDDNNGTDTGADTFAVVPGGGFKLTNGVDTTSSLSSASSASAVQTALEAFAAIAPGDVVVTKNGSGSDIVFTVQFDPGIDSNLALVDDGTPDPEMVQMYSATAGGVTEIQSLWTNATGGFLTINSVVVPMPATASEIQSALGGAGVATVTGSGTEADKYLITYVASGNQAYPTTSATNLATGAVTSTVATKQAGAAPAAKSWTLTITGASGGNYQLSFRGYKTGNIAYNANSATIQTALQGLASVGSGNMTVSGTGPFTITAAGTLAAEDQTAIPDIIAYNETLTGSTTFSVSIEEVQAATGPNHWDNDLNWQDVSDNSYGIPEDDDDVLIDLATEDRSIRYGLQQSGVTLNSIKITRAFEGHIGLPNWNGNGYAEYRDKELEIGLASGGDKLIVVGTGIQGSGSGLIRINTGTSQTILRVYRTGGPDADQPKAFMWRGTHANNSLELIDGSFAAGAFNEDAYTLDTITYRGGSLYLGPGGTVGDIEATGTSLYADEVALSGKFTYHGE